MQKKREALFSPMRRGVQRLTEQRQRKQARADGWQGQGQQEGEELPRAASAARETITQNVSCCWVEYKGQDDGARP